MPRLPHWCHAGAHPRQNFLLVQGLGDDRVDAFELVRRQLRQRQAEEVRDRPLGRERCRIAEFLEWVGIDKRLCRQAIGHAERGRLGPAFQGRARQIELRRQSLDPIGPRLRTGLLESAVVMQRDRPADRNIRAEALLPVFDVEFMVEQAPPQHYLRAGQFGIDLVLGAADRDAGICRHLAALRLAGKGAEALPTAHGPDAAGGKVL